MKILASLRARIVALLALTILPLFLLSLQVNLENRREALLQAEMRIQRLAQQIRNEERQVVDYTRQILQIMAHANDLERLDSPACSALSRRLLSTQPLFYNFGAVNPAGRVVCSGHPMDKTPVEVSERPWFIEAMTHKRFTQGTHVVGRISGKPGVIFGYPLLSPQGELRGAVFTNVGASWFERMLDPLELPPGWESGILDKAGLLLLSHPGHAASTRVASAGQWQAMTAAGSSTHQLHTVTGQDNTTRMVLLAPLESTRNDLWFYVSAPKHLVTGPAEDNFRTQLLVFLAIAILALALGFWAIDRSILAWARQLSDAARRFGNGEQDARVPEQVPIQELSELNQSFNRMADNLQARQAQQEADARHIAELNRLYSLLSAVNQCIVTAPSRRELLRNICQIAIEKGGFALAWIGFVDGDSQELTPVMQAGAVSFLRHGERPEGPSPAATAYHSGRLAVADDIHHNPPSGWRDNALMAGFRSAIGVPLQQRGATVGVLCLYTQTPGFFDATELRLLDEVGSDISYALDRLDTEAARQVAEARLARLNETPK